MSEERINGIREMTEKELQKVVGGVNVLKCKAHCPKCGTDTEHILRSKNYGKCTKCGDEHMV
ncbi:MAG: bacteriocin [Lachnospiraceae bacterium]|nr:bacteriocin [Lachnospiraceae bacterium]